MGRQIVPTMHPTNTACARLVSSHAGDVTMQGRAYSLTCRYVCTCTHGLYEQEASNDLPAGFAPQARARAVRSPAESSGRKEDEEVWSTPQKSLAGLKLHHGLPLNHAEEQKII